MIRIETTGPDEPVPDRFLTLPHALYRNHPCWNPHREIETATLLNPAMNPYWKQAERALFLAVDEDRVLGRIVAVDDRAYDREPLGQVGLFGFFECVEDPSVAGSLLDAAAEWLGKRGKKLMRGPFHPFPDPFGSGLLVEGFDRPQSSVEPYTLPYYPGYLEQNGMKVLEEYLSLYFGMNAKTNPLGYRVHLHLQKYFQTDHGVNVRPLRADRIAAEVGIIKGILDEAFVSDAAFSSLSLEMQAHLLELLTPQQDFSLCFIAECGGEPAGIWLAFPDRTGPLGVEQDRKDTCGERGGCICEFAVANRFRHTRVATAMIYHYWRSMLEQTYDYSRICYVEKDNRESLDVARDFGANPEKRFRLYEGRIGNIVY